MVTNNLSPDNHCQHLSRHLAARAYPNVSRGLRGKSFVRSFTSNLTFSELCISLFSPDLLGLVAKFLFQGLFGKLIGLFNKHVGVPEIQKIDIRPESRFKNN